MCSCLANRPPPIMATPIGAILLSLSYNEVVYKLLEATTACLFDVWFLQLSISTSNPKQTVIETHQNPLLQGGVHPIPLHQSPAISTPVADSNPEIAEPDRVSSILRFFHGKTKEERYPNVDVTVAFL